jgi:hypothetical protein
MTGGSRPQEYVDDEKEGEGTTHTPGTIAEKNRTRRVESATMALVLPLRLDKRLF